jgi:biotin carboxyl carrier protein
MARTLTLRHGEQEFAVTVEDNQVRIDGGDPIPAVTAPDGVALVGGPPRRTAWVRADGDTRWVFLDGRVYVFEATRAGGRRKSGGHHGTLAAPMPATVIRVQTETGAQVRRGDVLIVLEAMKMELPVRAPGDGVVTAIKCRVGELVQPGVALMEIEES